MRLPVSSPGIRAHASFGRILGLRAGGPGAVEDTAAPGRVRAGRKASDFFSGGVHFFGAPAWNRAIL